MNIVFSSDKKEYRKSKLFSQNGFGFLFCCYKSVTTAL